MMDAQNGIIVVIGEERLGMSSVSVCYARKIDGALATEASAHTLSYMLQKIVRPDSLVGKVQLDDEFQDNKEGLLRSMT